MISCMTWLFLLAGGVFIMLSLIRWFEQTAEAVDLGWWDKVMLLVVFPFAVWFFPSPVAAGRPMPVPVHEPVRGFGLNRPAPAPTAAPSPTNIPPPTEAPPGTPPQFLETPQIPPRPPRKRPPIDQAQIDKLRKQMREQGMLGDEDEG